MKNLEVTIVNNTISFADHQTNLEYWIESHKRLKAKSQKLYSIEFRIWCSNGLDSFEGDKIYRSIETATKEVKKWIKDERNDRKLIQHHPSSS